MEAKTHWKTTTTIYLTAIYPGGPMSATNRINLFAMSVLHIFNYFLHLLQSIASSLFTCWWTL